MTKNPSWKLPKVFVLIIPQVIRIHFGEWEVVILVVCHPGRGVPVKIPKDASSSVRQPAARSTGKFASRSLECVLRELPCVEWHSVRNIQYRDSIIPSVGLVIYNSVFSKTSV